MKAAARALASAPWTFLRRLGPLALALTPGWVSAQVEVILDRTGDGVGADELDDPRRVAIDSMGNVYVTCQLGVLKRAPDGTITEFLTTAGDGTHPLAYAWGIAVDPSDNVYVAGTFSNNVFKIDPLGTVTQIMDTTGDGAGNILERPFDVISDVAGNIYVTTQDSVGSGNVFKITPAGVITQIISRDGSSGSALLDGIVGIDVDDAGNLYLGVTGIINEPRGLFKLTPAGVLTQVIDSRPAEVRLVHPYGVAVDPTGNVYVASSLYDNLFQVNPAGDITEFNADGDDPLIDGPVGLVAGADGTIYMSNSGTDNVVALSPTGVTTEIADSTGAGGLAMLDPRTIVADAAGDLYLPCYGSNGLFKVTTAGFVTQLIGPVGDGIWTACDAPFAIATAPNGDAYVAAGVGSTSNVLRVTPTGDVSAVALVDGDGLGNQLQNPSDVVVDQAGNVFVSCLLSRNAFRINPGGVIEEILDETGDGANSLIGPSCIAVDPSGNVYVGGLNSNNVFRVTPAGVVTQVLDATGDGLGNTFSFPRDLAVDPSGNVYVTGELSDTVFRISPTGEITTILDSTGDGTNALDRPWGIAVDGARNVYVSSAGNEFLFRVSPSGVVDTVLTIAGDGTNPFEGPRGVAVSATGNVYVSGSRTRNVYEVALDGTATEIIDGPGVPIGVAVDTSGNVFVVGNHSDTAHKYSAPACAQQPGVNFRTGGTNPPSYTSTPASIGQDLVFKVNLETTGHDMALVFGFDSPFSLLLGGGQTLLCLDLLGSGGELINTGFHAGPMATISLPVPNDAALTGFTLSTQALHGFGVVPFALSNAQDIVIGGCP